MAAAVATAQHDTGSLYGHHEGHHYIGGVEEGGGAEERDKFSLMSLNNAKKKPNLKNAASDPVETFIKEFQASTEALDLNEGGETIDSVFQVSACSPPRSHTRTSPCVAHARSHGGRARSHTRSAPALPAAPATPLSLSHTHTHTLSLSLSLYDTH